MASSIIAISGKSGCGNTTVSRTVAEMLGLRFINYTFRSLAQERNMSLEQVIEAADGDPSWDKLLDARQVELAAMEDCVVGSRLAIWMIPKAALRVYLKAGLETRIARIHAREGGSHDEIASFTALRDEKDRRRYRETYGIDTDDLSLANLIIDTELWDARQIAMIIAEAYRARRRQE
jgi:cytidylate kinase